MISQFFVVSPRGDTLIFKDYRGDVPRTTSEKFWRHVKFCKGDAEPVLVCILNRFITELVTVRLRASSAFAG